MNLTNLPASPGDASEGWLEQRKLEAGLLLGGLIITGVGIFILKTAGGGKTVEILKAGGEATTAAVLVIDVEGAVNRPGVYELPVNTRVKGAIEIAGGLSGEADVNWVEANINQAEELKDGEKIYIPRKTASGESVSAETTSNNKISINSASESELDTLPGIGPVTAGKIIAGRPYQKLEELTERKIVGQSVYSQIKDLIALW